MTDFVGWFFIGILVYSAIVGIVAFIKVRKKKKALKEDEEKHKQKEEANKQDNQ